MSNALLKIQQKSKGLFPDEQAVIIQTADNEKIGLFCPNTCISNDKLSVRILEKGSELAMIELPGTPFNSSRFCVVKLAEIQGNP